LIDTIPVDAGPTDYFIKFIENSIDTSYLVTIKNTTYYFGSVDQVRFVFDGSRPVYDQRSGKVFSDYVNVLKYNSNSNNSSSLGYNYLLNVVDQPIQSDGLPNDFQITVSTIDQITGFTYDPDFFTDIIGTSTTAYVFFRIISDINDLFRPQLLPANLIITAFATLSQVEFVKYEYPAGTVFYCIEGNGQSGIPKFYQTVEVIGSLPPVLNVVDVSNQYLVTTGRSAINFQYRHNSSNTTRIDPATTNIIDLYVVTAAYYSSYQNWLRDTTGTVPFPPEPTINELQQSYGDLDSYKMISDSVILNSVTFKPLFGQKAAPALRGTLKIIKSPATTVSDSQIRSSVLTALNSYFTLDKWDFGDTFYFSELTAYLHLELGGLISSVVLVSSNPNESFGDLYEVRCGPSEIFVNGATSDDVIVVASLSPATLQRTI
jgi:hypothetical protein